MKPRTDFVITVRCIIIDTNHNLGAINYSCGALQSWNIPGSVISNSDTSIDQCLHRILGPDIATRFCCKLATTTMSHTKSKPEMTLWYICTIIKKDPADKYGWVTATKTNCLVIPSAIRRIVTRQC